MKIIPNMEENRLQSVSLQPSTTGSTRSSQSGRSSPASASARSVDCYVPSEPADSIGEAVPVPSGQTELVQAISSAPAAAVNNIAPVAVAEQNTGVAQQRPRSPSRARLVVQSVAIGAAAIAAAMEGLSIGSGSATAVHEVPAITQQAPDVSPPPYHEQAAHADPPAYREPPPYSKTDSANHSSDPNMVLR